MKHAARGSVRPMFWSVSEISAPDTPQDPGPGASGTASLGRNLMLLIEATTRDDDRIESQRGGVLFEGDRTVIATFGSKCAAVARASPPRRQRCADPVRTPTCSSTQRGAPWRGCFKLRPPPPPPRAQKCARRSPAVSSRRAGPGPSTSEPAPMPTWPTAVQARAPAPGFAFKGVLIAAARTDFKLPPSARRQRRQAGRRYGRAPPLTAELLPARPRAE